VREQNPIYQGRVGLVFFIQTKGKYLNIFVTYFFVAKMQPL